MVEVPGATVVDDVGDAGTVGFAVGVVVGGSLTGGVPEEGGVPGLLCGW